MDYTPEDSAQAMARAAEEAALRERGDVPMVPAGAGSEVAPVHKTRISVENVDLYYGDHHALKDVSIERGPVLWRPSCAEGRFDRYSRARDHLVHRAIRLR